MFAAGAGPGSGPERKLTVDRAAAVKCVDAAEAAGVARFVIVSSIGAHDPDGRARADAALPAREGRADAHVAASSLDWTIVRPGSLTDDPGTGRVEVTTDLGRRGPCRATTSRSSCSRRSRRPATIRLTFEVFAGDAPARDALRNLSPPRDV